MSTPSATCSSCGARSPATDAAWCASARRRAARAPAAARYTPRDSFYERAHEAGYRSRGVFKLDDLLVRLPPLRAGDAVVELGCWPGGWLQRLGEIVGPTGRVVGVDLREVEPLGAPVETSVLDFADEEAPETLRAALGRPARLVLSDAAPGLTGIADVDRAAMQEIHEAALRVAGAVLAPGGAFAVKAFPGPETDAFRKTLREAFARVAALEPEGRRRSSKEFYLLATPAPPRGARRGRNRRGRRT